MVETTLAPPEHKTVLVVEDNVWSRKLLETRLEIHGFRWVSSSDGELALEIAREQRPDLILMDIQLPGISGVEAIRRLKKGRAYAYDTNHCSHRLCAFFGQNEDPRQRL